MSSWKKLPKSLHLLEERTDYNSDPFPRDLPKTAAPISERRKDRFSYEKLASFKLKFISNIPGDRFLTKRSVAWRDFQSFLRGCTIAEKGLVAQIIETDVQGLPKNLTKVWSFLPRGTPAYCETSPAS
ncbi:hypothetical protein CEXT_328751 [Caerostris extrusa]|uniref:Uncharacterized protein n=1 Tax=Caerostris extrusa TaxID=172846 RepID=A0AAV4Q124_CAEEX|nr:hypothetical protein CEXT_328751 [Caerostris extrusa]